MSPGRRTFAVVLACLFWTGGGAPVRAEEAATNDAYGLTLVTDRSEAYLNGRSVNLTVLPMKNGQVWTFVGTETVYLRAVVRSSIGRVDARKLERYDGADTPAALRGSSLDAETLYPLGGIYTLASRTSEGFPQQDAVNSGVYGSLDDPATSHLAVDRRRTLGREGVVPFDLWYAGVSVFYEAEPGTDGIRVTLQRVSREEEGGARVETLAEGTVGVLVWPHGPPRVTEGSHLSRVEIRSDRPEVLSGGEVLLELRGLDPFGNPVDTWDADPLYLDAKDLGLSVYGNRRGAAGFGGEIRPGDKIGASFLGNKGIRLLAMRPYGTGIGLFGFTVRTATGSLTHRFEIAVVSRMHDPIDRVRFEPPSTILAPGEVFVATVAGVDRDGDPVDTEVAHPLVMPSHGGLEVYDHVSGERLMPGDEVGLDLFTRGGVREIRMVAPTALGDYFLRVETEDGDVGATMTVTVANPQGPLEAVVFDPPAADAISLTSVEVSLWGENGEGVTVDTGYSYPMLLTEDGGAVVRDAGTGERFEVGDRLGVRLSTNDGVRRLSVQAPEAPGTYHLRVNAFHGGANGSFELRVDAPRGPLERLTVSPSRLRLAPGTTADIEVTGWDAWGKMIDTASVNPVRLVSAEGVTVRDAHSGDALAVGAVAGANLVGETATRTLRVVAPEAGGRYGFRLAAEDGDPGGTVEVYVGYARVRIDPAEATAGAGGEARVRLSLYEAERRTCSLYLVLVLPGGAYACLTAPGVFGPLNTPRPILEHWVPETLDGVEVLRVPLDAVPPGLYAVQAVLLPGGSALEATEDWLQFGAATLTVR